MLAKVESTASSGLVSRHQALSLFSGTCVCHSVLRLRILLIPGTEEELVRLDHILNAFTG